MKIAMITHTYLPKIGGREIHVSKLSEALVKRGHEIVIITSDEGYCPRQPKIQVIRLNEIKLLMSVHPETNYYRVLPNLYRAVIKSGCDILHMHDLMHFTTDSMSYFGNLLGMPSVLTIHGFKPETSILNFFVKLYNNTLASFNFRFVDRIILPSRALCDVIPALQKFVGKLRVVPNGLEIKTEKAKDFEYPTNLLAVGRLVPRKGFQYLIKAMPDILSHFPETTLNIVGPDGGFRTNLIKIVNDLGLNSQVRLLGKVSEDKLEKLYRSSSICINPSIWDNAPLTILEALSWGTPVIASKIGGIPEIIESGYNGVLVQAEDPSSISKGVFSIIHDNVKYRKIAGNALESAKSLTWERIAKKTEDIYEEII